MRDAAALMIMQMVKVSKVRQLADGPLDPAEMEPGELNASAVAESNEPESVIRIFAIGGIDDEAE